MTHNDYITLGCFAFLFACACAAIAYMVGHSHGVSKGTLAGIDEQRRASSRKIILAYRNGQSTGRKLALLEQERRSVLNRKLMRCAINAKAITTEFDVRETGITEHDVCNGLLRAQLPPK